jgi:hypothetical protein
MKTLLFAFALLISTMSFSQSKKISLDTLSYQEQHDLLYTHIYERLKKKTPYLEIHDRETSDLIFKELEAYRKKYVGKGKEPIDFIGWALKTELSKK